MRRCFAVLVLCFLVASAGLAQNAVLKPMHVPAGTVLTFYLQTRLNSNEANALDLLPKGTQLNVRLLEPIDSAINRDGSEFRGVIASPVASQEGVVIHAEAEVKGLFALLRSKNHPDGFRYELLVTGITDGGKSFQLTASLNPSFLDAPSEAPVRGPSSNGESAASLHK